MMFALRTRAVAVARPLGACARSLARARADSPPRRGGPRRGGVRRRWRTVATAAADASEDSASPEPTPAGVILLFGYHPDEVPPLAELVGALAQEMDAGELAVARVAGDALGVTAEFLLDGAEMDARAETDETDDSTGDSEDAFSQNKKRLPPATRCVLLRGEPAKALMPDLKLEMVDAGFAPAVFGAFTAAHAFAPLGAVAGAVVAAHERYWDLGAVANDDDVFETAATAWPGEEAWSPTRDPVCVMSCEMDAARVPDPPAFPFACAGDEDDTETEIRVDSSAVVVLDGVVGEPLRAALMDAFTEPGWPHATATGPPPGKWVRETNDGVGALPSGGASPSGSAEDSARDRDFPNSWGLSATALAAVARSPSVRTVLARVGALYPEYAVRFMPADALEPEGAPGAMSDLFGNGNDARQGNDGDGDVGCKRIATVVGNAAVKDDSFQWHLDMDPACLHPSAPLAERFGLYVNRSRARPLFVSALVYLNGPEPWTPEKDAETLVLDPGTGTGVFIRPAPGRVLLMDQDATHRVSPPSRSTDTPRYSAVFKLCFYPKDTETRPSLTREEWGAPIRFGTAGGRRAGAGMLGGGEESEEAYVPG